MNIRDAFDQLIQSIESELVSIKQKGKDHFDDNEISQARETLDKVEKIQGLIKQIHSLKEKWEQEFSVTELTTQTEDDEEDEENVHQEEGGKVVPEIDRPLPQKFFSSQSDFYRPILQAMVELGGGGNEKELTDKIMKIIQEENGEIDENDRHYVRGKTIVWKVNLRNAFVSLQKKGYTSGSSITDKGREYLKKLESRL